MFLSSLFCRNRAACQQGTKSAREERKPFLLSHHHCLAPLKPGHGGGGICGRVEIVFGYWRRGRWRVVGERGDRTRRSAARPGNTIKLSADLLSLTYNTSLSLFLNLSPLITIYRPFAKAGIRFQKVTNIMTFSEQKTAETAIM